MFLYTALKGTEKVKNEQFYCKSICSTTLFSCFLSASTDLNGDTRAMENSGMLSFHQIQECLWYQVMGKLSSAVASAVFVQHPQRKSLLVTEE